MEAAEDEQVMHTLKIGLSEVRVSPKFLAQSCVWTVDVNGTEYVIRRDDTGSWMQQCRDDLSPELLFSVGQAIESLFDGHGRNEV